MKNKYFIAIGFSLAAHLSFAQSAVENTSPVYMVEDTLTNNTILPHDAQKIEISNMSFFERHEYFRKIDDITKKDLDVALKNGLYPEVGKNIDKLWFDYENEKTSSEAFYVQKMQNDKMTYDCKVVLGIRNHEGIPNLDFEIVKKAYNIDLDPITSRLFVMLHELAHCEADFRGEIGYHNAILTDNENAQLDAWSKKQNLYDSQEKKTTNTLEYYYDETFADSYAAVALLKMTNFSAKTLSFLQDLASIREQMADEHSDDFLADPHSTYKSLDMIVQMSKTPEFKNLILSDTNGVEAYNTATTLASRHLDYLMNTSIFKNSFNKNALYQSNEALLEKVNKQTLADNIDEKTTMDIDDTAIVEKSDVTPDYEKVVSNIIVMRDKFLKKSQSISLANK